MTTHPPAIRWRIGRALLHVSLAWGVVIAALMVLIAHQEIDDVLDDALHESAEVLLGVLSYNADQLPLAGGGAMPAPVHDESLLWQLVAPNHTVLLRSHRAPREAFVAAGRTGLDDSGEGGEWRVVSMPFPQRGATLQVAQSVSRRRDSWTRAAAIASGAALAVGLACALWLRSRVRRELLPLREFSANVTDFHPLEPGARLALASRDELVPIRDAIADLGERLALRVASERAVTAHAAHALRTPLAGMTAQLAVAMRECPPDMLPRLQRAREASERLGRVVAALLTLFRSGVEPCLQPCTLQSLIGGIPMDGLRVQVGGDAQPLMIDPDLMAAALMNILDNATRMGAQHVQMDVQRQDAVALVRISDDGPGVGAERLQALQSALAQQRYEAPIGLGLMLADLIARAHRGSLAVLSGGDGLPPVHGSSGFTVEIRLPQAAAAPPHRHRDAAM